MVLEIYLGYDYDKYVNLNLLEEMGLKDWKNISEYIKVKFTEFEGLKPLNNCSSYQLGFEVTNDNNKNLIKLYKVNKLCPYRITGKINKELDKLYIDKNDLILEVDTEKFIERLVIQETEKSKNNIASYEDRRCQNDIKELESKIEKEKEILKILNS